MFRAWVLLVALAIAGTVEMPSGDPLETHDGDLAAGKEIDLAWAAQSNVACFPGPNFKYFNGNHQFYTFAQHANHDLYIRATPEAGVDLSVYVLQNAKPDGAQPPNIDLAWRCSKAWKDNPGEPETLKVDGYKGNFNVLIGVTAPNAAKTGKYKLELWEKPGRQW